MIGEHRHLILQALSRGAVRKCRGVSCPEVNAYIIASAGSGIAEELPTIFPGCDVVLWKPVTTDLKGKAGEALKFVIGSIEAGATAFPSAP